MALTECPNGHLYDSDQYAACPYCGGTMNRVEFGTPEPGSGVTMPVVAFQASGPDIDGAPLGEVAATVAPASYQGRRGGPEEDIGKTVGIFQKNFSREPVAGWLVCVDGPEKGKDYRIATKNNSIGRSETMDICIRGDRTVSRENHARLSYDGKHCDFYLIPAASTNNIYLNDEPVFLPTKLKARDVIEIGEGKFVFVPFCDDWFDWQSGMKKDE